MIPRYRAWDEKNKEMFKDTFAVTESGAVVTVEQEFITNAPDYIFVDHLTLMQSTGLTDKDGKEIFEGDIIDSTDGFLTGVIEFRVSLGMFVSYLVEYNNFERLCNIASSRKIIGNIWEHPELAEVSS